MSENKTLEEEIDITKCCCDNPKYNGTHCGLCGKRILPLEPIKIKSKNRIFKKNNVATAYHHKKNLLLLVVTVIQNIIFGFVKFAEELLVKLQKIMKRYIQKPNVFGRLRESEGRRCIKIKTIRGF